MRDQLLDTAEQMVQDRGLNAVSFQQLADKVGISKPSVFHHFKSKQALSKALVERCHTKYGQEYAKIISRDISAPDKLRAIAEIFASSLNNGQLCMLGSLSGSVTTLPEDVRDDLRLAVAGTIDRYARVFEQGQQEHSLDFEGSPEDVAFAYLAMLEGLQMLARAKRDHAAFIRAASSYIESMTAH